jgi:hypothetical protein
LPSSSSSSSEDEPPKCTEDVTQLLDGKVNDPSSPVIGSFCDARKPVICDHAARDPLDTPGRSCAVTESYTSSKNALTLRHFYSRGTAISSVNFTLKYEFVDVSVGDPCNWLIASSGTSGVNEIKNEKKKLKK